jgi:hypothetical protein
MSEDLCFMPATEMAARIRRRALSPVEAVEAFLTRIGTRNSVINAYVTVIADQARAAARGRADGDDGCSPASAARPALDGLQRVAGGIVDAPFDTAGGDAIGAAGGLGGGRAPGHDRGCGDAERQNQACGHGGAHTFAPPSGFAATPP